MVHNSAFELPVFFMCFLSISGLDLPYRYEIEIVENTRAEMAVELYFDIVFDAKKDFFKVTPKLSKIAPDSVLTHNAGVWSIKVNIDEGGQAKYTNNNGGSIIALSILGVNGKQLEPHICKAISQVIIKYDLGHNVAKGETKKIVGNFETKKFKGVLLFSGNEYPLTQFRWVKSDAPGSGSGDYLLAAVCDFAKKNVEDVETLIASATPKVSDPDYNSLLLQRSELDKGRLDLAVIGKDRSEPAETDQDEEVTLILLSDSVSMHSSKFFGMATSATFDIFRNEPLVNKSIAFAFVAKDRIFTLVEPTVFSLDQDAVTDAETLAIRYPKPGNNQSLVGMIQQLLSYLDNYTNPRLILIATTEWTFDNTQDVMFDRLSGELFSNIEKLELIYLNKNDTSINPEFDEAIINKINDHHKGNVIRLNIQYQHERQKSQIEIIKKALVTVINRPE